MNDLFQRRLLIQSGKGGTGKTTISAALARLAAARGKRVLLVEVDTQDRFAPLFGRREPIAYEPREVSPGVHAQNLDPELVVVDFFQTHVRFKAFYKQILESRIFRHFYEAAPGVREIICMGKIWRILGERQFLTGRPTWDLVVLDAPATGHGISLLHIAEAAYQTLFGPMKKHAEKIRDMLRDPLTTALNIVSLPEEMPVNESADLHRLALETLHTPLGVCVLNGTTPALHDAEEAAAFAREAGAQRLERLTGGPRSAAALRTCVKAREERAKVSARQAARLASLVPLPIVEVPRVFEARPGDGSLLPGVEAALERGLVQRGLIAPGGDGGRRR